MTVDSRSTKGTLYTRVCLVESSSVFHVHLQQLVTQTNTDRILPRTSSLSTHCQIKTNLLAYRHYWLKPKYAAFTLLLFLTTSLFAFWQVLCFSGPIHCTQNKLSVQFPLFRRIMCIIWWCDSLLGLAHVFFVYIDW